MNAAATRTVPAYRIIYNWDGAPHHYSAFPQSLDEFLDKTFAPLRDTQVDALFWCMGIHEATWPSEEIPMVGDSGGRVYDSVRSLRDTENLRAMLDRGENPCEAMVARGREVGIDVWSSIRMNDQHIRIDDLARMERTVAHGLTQLRKAHPQWCLGEQAPALYASSWNLAVPEVREHKLQLIEEACRQADWDGVELDWQRHAFHLPQRHEWRLRYALTDLQRAVRRLADRIAAERGRPFYVAARVAPNLEACRRVGYDVEAWAREGLCDILIGGGNSGTDPCFETEAFRRLTKGTAIRVYPGFDSDGRQQAQRPVPHAQWRDEWFAGMACGHLQRGADGVYCFNWHAAADTRRASLTTLGSLDTLARVDKVYTAVHRSLPDGGGSERDRDDRLFGEVPVDLYRTLTDDGPTVHVEVFDQGVSAQLLVELGHFSEHGDAVRVELDGLELGPPSFRDLVAEDSSSPEDAGENRWLVWPLTAAQAAPGTHAIRVVLRSRDERLRVPLVLENVEIWVRHDG